MPGPAQRRLTHALRRCSLPPLLLGVIDKTKALFAGRVGPPLLQPYYDLVKLLRKGSVFSRTTTWVFRAGPVVGLVTALLAALARPARRPRRADLLRRATSSSSPTCSALGRFFTVAAALDTGSAFEGMGGAREVTFSCLAEPALFLGLLVLARASGSLSLSTMLGPALPRGWHARRARRWCSWSSSLFVVLLAENCRIPFDDPNTHLELTMIHEVMVLDHGGPALRDDPLRRVAEAVRARRGHRPPRAAVGDARPRGRTGPCSRRSASWRSPS